LVDQVIDGQSPVSREMAERKASVVTEAGKVGKRDRGEDLARSGR
jgi:hypothetical protein